MLPLEIVVISARRIIWGQWGLVPHLLLAGTLTLVVERLISPHMLVPT
jgi:hypothetical protein